MRLLLLLLALALGHPAPALAQSSADYRTFWPLTPGNTWVYVDTQSSITPQYATGSVIGSTVWTALDSVTVAAGRLPKVRVERSSGAPVECLVSFQTLPPWVAGGHFRLLDTTGAEPCSVDRPKEWDLSGSVLSPGFSALALEESADPVDVGGVSYGVYRTAWGEAQDGDWEVGYEWRWHVADALGLLAYGEEARTLGGYRLRTESDLRWARVDGRTYGQPLASRPGFLPLAVGNRWEYGVAYNGVGHGAVAWTVVPDGSGVAMRLDRVVDGAVTSTVTCPVTVVDASAATGWQTRFRLDCALPDPILFPQFGTAASLWVDTFVADTTATVGTQTVPADLALAGAGWGFWAASWEAARDIGVTSYTVVHPEWPTRIATLGYARVGGVTYGQQVIASDGAPPSASLRLTVGPNPAAGSLTVQFDLPMPTEARLTLVDALGREVRALDLGTRPVVTGTETVALGGLAPGVYTVRLAAGGAVATARVSVVR